MTSLLEVDAVNTYYGESHVLFDVSLHVEEGEVVALLGRNGSGKTTTMHTIMGVVAPRSGRVRVAGEDVTGLRPHAVAQRSVQLVPDTRRIVKTITVEENLRLAAFTAKRAWPLEHLACAAPFSPASVPLSAASPNARTASVAPIGPMEVARSVPPSPRAKLVALCAVHARAAAGAADAPATCPPSSITS